MRAGRRPEAPLWARPAGPARSAKDIRGHGEDTGKTPAKCAVAVIPAEPAGAITARKMVLMAVMPAGIGPRAPGGGSNSELAPVRPAGQSAGVGHLAPRDRGGLAIMDTGEGQLARVVVVRGSGSRP